MCRDIRYYHNCCQNVPKNLRKKNSPSCKSRKNKKWFDADIRLKRKHLMDYAKIYTLYSKDPFVRGHFYKLRREYAKLRKYKCKEFKRNMIEKLDNLHQNNPKMYWNLINELSNKPAKDKSSLISANTWSSHFSSLNQTKDSFRSRILHLNDKVAEMEARVCFNELDSLISECEISKAISKLRCNKSPGLERISNYMIKYGQNSLIPSLKKMFNACLSHGHYPKLWSEGIITVLHKSGDALDPNNYRGITITSAIGKLLNSILNTRLDDFLVKNRIIKDCQIGFTKGASTSDHMFVLKSIIDTYCHNKVGRIFACFVDFRKAFDTVIHSGIKYKLLKLGVGSKFYNLIKSMYANSKSCIRLSNTVTKFFDSRLGVKQGDNLSPNLFKIFINDLPDYFEGTPDPVILDCKSLHCLMYADDVIILSQSAEGLQQKLNKLQMFCDDWCLDVNINKTKVLIFNKSGKLLNFNFSFRNKLLENVASYRYLGVNFTASGSFSFAQEELYKKALKAFFKLQKDLLILQPSVKTSLHVFDHTIKPILLYGCEVWGGFNSFTARFRNTLPSLDKIYSKLKCESLHIRFCKFILGVHSKCTNFAVLSELGRFPLHFDILKQMLVYMNRLENLGNRFPLLKAAYAQSKTNFSKKIPSWYGSLAKTMEIIQFNENVLQKKPSPFKKTVKAILKRKYLSDWINKREMYCNGKLDVYTKLKNNFGLEKYLLLLPFEQRRKLSKLRTSSHKLQVERGRYVGTPREQRICKKCPSLEVEDEYHLLLRCSVYNSLRENLFNLVLQHCGVFTNLSDENKLIWLLNNENTAILNAICELVQDSV